MILALVYGFFGSVTAITCGSLWLANAMDKRDGEPEAKIYPFVLPLRNQTQCPLCGYPCKDKEDDGGPSGPSKPYSCEDGDRCPGFPVHHVHMDCYSCHGSWLMKARIDVKTGRLS